ncbi:pilus assembly protein HicB [Paenibacillus dendritiformis]|uniref:type II toxin-antitoxin system HicB family antitoxin n=1 Tax=Paenibacillus dendritiformis TaxID=130049 RepID=UPI0018CCCC90|nr:type II toxin-antitoxin system HicB family antitoxin [Paenibacillus dendritiformis]MBG9795874.1 pilus assembly protein HicB [Paenibacillus dendritiformis]
MKDRYIFPAIFDYADDGISVEFPDLPGTLTYGDTDEEALNMAKECLALHLYGMEKDGEVIPEPTRAINLSLESNQSAVLIDVWMPPFRDYMAEKAVKKTLTIPKWLNDAAEEANVNFSRILQDGLKSYLGVTDRKSYEKGPVE